MHTSSTQLATFAGGCFWCPEAVFEQFRGVGYFRRNPTQGYCRVVIAPNVAKARATFMAQLREA